LFHFQAPLFKVPESSTFRGHPARERERERERALETVLHSRGSSTHQACHGGLAEGTPHTYIHLKYICVGNDGWEEEEEGRGRTHC